MSYADKLSIPFVVLIGEDEMAAGVVTVKNMLKSEQVKLPVAEAAAHIKAEIERRAQMAVIKEG